MPLLSIGFTGTRKGLTTDQSVALRSMLKSLGTANVTFHHGDCLGADSEAHDIAKHLGYHVITHPPKNQLLRAFRAGNEERLPKSYSARNADIVAECEHLLVCPKEHRICRHGGTWQTYRLGLYKKPLTLIWPSGNIQFIAAPDNEPLTVTSEDVPPERGR